MRFRWLILFIPLMVFAQNTGKISGKIIDKETNDPLIGVNVIIKGTYYGSATDLNGRYYISGISAGTYNIEASIIGYKILLQTGISVELGKTTFLDYRMEETVLTLGEEVVVIGSKPLFDVDETASVVRITSEDIANKVVSSVEDILSEQIGVTTHDNEIHIRGGRIDESMFIVDGQSVKDPLSGYSGNLFVNPEAIQELEIVTGGYNAEYGQAMSGIINIRLKEGRKHFEGSFKYASDNWGMGQDVISHFSTDRVEFNVGGPDPLLELFLPKLGIDLPGSFSIFINGYGKMYDSNLPTSNQLYPHRYWSVPGLESSKQDDLLSSLAGRENNDWHGLYKLTWRITPKKKFSISYDISLNINQGYFMPRAFSSTYFPYTYQQILDNYNTITRETRLLNMNWTHTLSTRSFYEITMGRFLTLEHSAVQDLHWTEYDERLDLDPINYTVVDQDGNITITYGDEFYDTGFAPEWYDVSSDNYRFDIDWVYRTQNRHKIKAGVENTLTEIQVLDIDEPWAGTSGFGANYDMYNARTTFGAFYVQDRITFEGMTVNVGMRYDYWFPGKYVEDAINNPNTVIITDVAREKFNNETFDLFGFKGKGRFSPRFGISHPVTDNDVLYFYYGHFSQLPTFQYVYAKLNSVSQSTYQVFGNPNLNPKTTVQYELGIKHRFSEDQVLELKAYWKDMFDYETSQTITPSNPKYAHLRFNMYFNADYARARGIEIILKSRVLKRWYVDLNFNYSIITGKSSTPLDNLLVQAGALNEKPLGENFMSWDKPLQFFSNIYYNHPANWGVAVRIEFGTGRRYTRSILGTNDYEDGIRYIEGVPYYVGPRDGDNPYAYFSEYTPELFKILGMKNVSGYGMMDVKLHKTFNIAGLKYKLYLDLENVFNEQIPRRVNPYTGHGYNPEQIIPYSMISIPNPNYDPSRNSKPRTIELGLQVIF
jgi:outer membrane receptor for ferrienterochelin and colicin